MLNNLTNFFNIITGKMIKKVPENSDLIPLGTRDTRYGGNYKPTAISVEDFISSIPVPTLEVSWGEITGFLSLQTDLQSALSSKNPLISHLQYNNTSKTIWNQGNSINSLSYGNNALISITSGVNNTALGNGALQNLTSGNTNTAVGINSLQICTTGTLNTAVGAFSQLAVSTGTNNTSMGYRALRNTTTGSYNIGIGNDCFLSNSTGSANIGIGFSVVSNNWSNSLALGHNVALTGDNQFHVGSSTNTLGIVTTEAITQTETWTVFINGVQRKILLG